jgi:ElaB/YqjD/DUF883 family membrane-anchored ribosome-binding protein
MSNIPTSSNRDPMRTGRSSESTATGSQTMAEQARAGMETAADYGRSAVESVSRTSMTTYSSFRDQVERNPVTSVLSAVAVGFLLGALWRSPPRYQYGYNSLPSRSEVEGWFSDLMRSASRQLNRNYSSIMGNRRSWW